MEEIWKDIDGYEGLYQVSNLGNVRSLNFGRKKEIQKLKPRKTRAGYLQVDLCGKGKTKTASVHRLVAGAFLDNIDNHPYINHKDENKENNNIENLEWCSPKYNYEYSVSLHPERKPFCKVERKGRKTGMFGAYKHTLPVLQLTKDGKIIKIWETVCIAGRETGWRASSIVDCCNGKRHTAYGYIWRFAS